MALLIVAGCGGGNGEDGNGGEELPPGVSLSKPEFTERAADACREARGDLRGEATRFLALQDNRKPKPVRNADLAHLVLLPAIEAEMEAIRVLGVPPSERERIDPLLDESESAINRVVYEERIPSIAAVYRKFAGVSRAFRAYGLPECVNGSAVIDLRG